MDFRDYRVRRDFTAFAGEISVVVHDRCGRPLYPADNTFADVIAAATQHDAECTRAK